VDFTTNGGLLVPGSCVSEAVRPGVAFGAGDVLVLVLVFAGVAVLAVFAFAAAAACAASSSRAFSSAATTAACSEAELTAMGMFSTPAGRL